MLVKDINIKFGDKIIFEHENFEAKERYLTLILGKSGTGKSTLLNYIMNQVPSDKIAYLQQNPIFHPDLTMKEQMEMIQSIYGQEFKQRLVDSLDINKTMNSYPLNLSGGEKLRWGFLLTIIKTAEIVLCDEPTASLDWKKKELVMKYLNEYAKQGHTVIVVSHDEEFKEYADTIYTINNTHLYKQKDDLKKREKNCSSDIKLDTNHLAKYLKKCVKHNYSRNLLINVLLAISICLVCFSIKFKEKIFDLNGKVTCNMNQMVVYKPSDGYKDMDFSYFADEDGLNANEVKEIESVEHVVSVKKRYDYQTFSVLNNIVEDKEFKYIDYYNYNLIDENNNEYPLDLKLYGGISFLSYDHDFNYTEDIAIQLGEEQGLYLSPNMYEIIKEISGISNIKNCKLTFTFLVPIYKLEYGISSVGDSDCYLVNRDTCVPVTVTLPISGVSRTKKFGVLFESETREHSMYNIIYYPDTILDEYLENEHVDIHVLNTVLENGQVRDYLDRLPENYDAYISCSYIYPWLSNSYFVEVDNINSIMDVKLKLENMGYEVLSDVKAEDNGEFLDFIFQKSFKVIALLFSLVVLVVYTFITYLRQNRIKEENEFLKEYLIEEKNIRKAKVLKYSSDTIRLIIMSTFLLLFLIWYISSSKNIQFKFTDAYMIIIIIVISLIYKWIIPGLVGETHDKY